VIKPSRPDGHMKATCALYRLQRHLGHLNRVRIFVLIRAGWCGRLNFACWVMPARYSTEQRCGGKRAVWFSLVLLMMANSLVPIRSQRWATMATGTSSPRAAARRTWTLVRSSQVATRKMPNAVIAAIAQKAHR
jgi:hypothetical protein